MAITVPNVVKVTGSGVTSVTTSGVTTTTGSTFVGWSTADVGVTINAPTDSKSNSYGTAKVTVNTSGTSSKQVVYVKENGTGGASHTLTFTYSAATYPTVFLVECAGAATASYDSGSLTSGASAAGTPFARNSGGQAQANNAILAFVATDAGGTLTYTNTGYTVSQEQDGNNYWTGAVGRQIVSQTSAVTSSFAVSPGASNGGTITFAIKEAAAGGGTAVNPGVGTVAITGYAPSIAQPQTASPGVGTVTLTGYAPAVTQGTNVAPGVGSLTITGYAPSIAQPQTAAPGAGSLALTGYAPSVVQNTQVAPGVGSVSIAGFAPTVKQQYYVLPGAGSVAFTGYAPTVAQTANQAVNPGAGSLALTGYAPTVVQASASLSVDAGAGLLTLTGYAPDVVQSGRGGGYDAKAKVRKRINEANRRILEAEALEEAQEITQAAVTKAKSATQSAVQGADEDEDEALMLLL